MCADNIFTPNRSGCLAGVSIEVIVYTDGGSRGNPGDAAYGIIVCSKDGEVLKETSRYIGEATNNEAEYRGMLAGLDEARKQGADEVKMVTDSELVVKQMTGEYRVRAKNLRPMAEEVRVRASTFDSVSYEHVSREDPMISRADALVNQELDDRELLKKIRK